MHRRHTVPLLALAIVAGCSPDIPRRDPPRVVLAEFDLAASPPRLPQPNDLALDPRTHRVTITDPTPASDAERAWNDYLRSLDGYLESTPATATFSAPINPASATPANVTRAGAILVADRTEMRTLAPADYTITVAADGLSLAIRPQRGRWQLGHTYVVLIFGGDDPNGLKASSADRPVIASPFTFFLRSPRALLRACAGSDAADCPCPRDPASGGFDRRCTPAVGLSLAEATRLEPVRREIDAVWSDLVGATGGTRKRENAVLLWSFTIASGPFARFDLATAELPLPNDAQRDARSGRVNLPIEPGASPAQRAFISGLNQLDGFSTTGSVTLPVATFDGAAPRELDPERTLRLVNLTHPDRPPAYEVAAQRANGQDYDGRLAMVPRRPLEPDGERYLAVATRGITDSRGRPLQRSPELQLLTLPVALVDGDGHSTLPAVVDDAAAAQLEAVRSAWAQSGLWDEVAARLDLRRDNVAALWTFRTQSLSKPLADLAALPAKRALPTDVELSLEVVTGNIAGAPAPAVAALGHGHLHSRLALGKDGLIDLASTRDVDVPLLLALPKRWPPAGARVAIVQHGFGSWRGDARFLAQALAEQGMATLAIDLNFHGGRTACLDKRQCSSGGACNEGVCTTRLNVTCSDDAQCALGGKCNRMTGSCAGGLAPESRLCMTHREGGAAITECNPAASGAAFVRLDSPFLLRDNLRQHVVDLAQLVRVIAASGPNSLRGRVAKAGYALDGDRVTLVGHSLGGITGALFLAARPAAMTAVLHGAGSPLVDLFAASPSLHGVLDGVLAQQGVFAGTPEQLLLLDRLRWALDPGDPINFARHVAAGDLACPGESRCAKRVILQVAGMDSVVPGRESGRLAQQLGLPLDGEQHPGVVAMLAGGDAPPSFVSTFFPSAAHEDLFASPPGAATAAVQRQATSWLAADGRELAGP